MQQQALDQLRLEVKMQIYTRTCAAYVNSCRIDDEPPLDNVFERLGAAAHVASLCFLESEGVKVKKEPKSNVELSA